jgi:hypothetical protein
MLFLLSLLASSWSVEPEVVQQRLSEVQPLRAKRLDHNAPSFDRSAYDKAAKGTVATGLISIEGHKAKKAWGVAVVDVPIGAFWAAINDDPGKVGITRLAYAEVLSGGRCGSPRRVFQFLPVPLVTDRWWVTEMNMNSSLMSTSSGRVREMTWATDGNFDLPTASAKEWGDKGMHVASTQGSWFLVDLDGSSTLIEYYTWSDPGGSLPAGMASSMAASGISGTIDDMVTLARKGPYCKVE